MKSKLLRFALTLGWATGLGPLLSSQDLPSLVLGDPIFGEEDWQLGFSVDLDPEGNTQIIVKKLNHVKPLISLLYAVYHNVTDLSSFSYVAHNCTNMQKTAQFLPIIDNNMAIGKDGGRGSCR